MATKKQKPIKIVTLDTETYNGLIGGIKRIAIYDGIEKTFGYTFLDIEPKLLEYYKQGFDTHVYIHNLEFDLRKIPEVLDSSRVNWSKCFVINGKMATVSCKKYTIHDSFKLLPSSLDSLSKDFGVTHGKLDLWEAVQKAYPGVYTDKVDFLDRCDRDDPIYLEYLGYDVVSLYEVIEKLIELTGISKRDFVGRISTSSLSRFLFKNGYKGQEFKNPLDSRTDYEIMTQYNWRRNLEVEEFIRASYCGGRTEVFKPRLDHRAYHYDVNSLYPAQFDDEYPIGKPEYYNEPKLAEHYYRKWCKDKIGLGIVSCEVFIPQQNIPPLPVKMGKLVFPCGVVYGTWTYEELRYAEENCGVVIREFYEVAHFENTYPVFKRFKDCFYQLKEQGTIEKNMSLRTLAKLILNVMYGYTGMTRDDKTQLRPYKDLHKYDQVKFADKELGYIEIPADINAEYIQVQIATYVTARARLVLLKALKDCDSRGNVYYCDTDSIVTDVPLAPEMVHESKLGFWDLESEPEKGIFLRPKVYAELYDMEKSSTKKKDDKKAVTVKFKGVTRDTQNEFSFDSYESLYRELLNLDKDYVIVEKNRLTMRSIMYLEKEGIDLNENRINDKEKGIKSGYEIRDKKMNLKTVEKRQIDYEKNFTKPWYFSSVEEFDKFDFKPPKAEVQFSMVNGGHL